jgi:serine protease Do
MRSRVPLVLALSVPLAVALGALHARPLPQDRKANAQPPAFRPIEINDALTQNDGNDEKLQNPAKKYPVKLHKDKTYIIDLVSKDFDAYLRLLDRKGNQLAEDDDGGGDLNARIIHGIEADGDYQIVATSLDGQLGKFTLRVREFTLKGEARARPVGKDGLSITDQINQNSATDLGKLGKVFSVQLQAGQTYVIDLESATMDSYLYLFDGKSKLLAQDDDSGDDLNSRIVFRAERDGVYHLLATTLDGDETGEFTLKVRKKE